MTARALLNVTHALIADQVGPEGRADLDALMHDPIGWREEQQQQVLTDLVAAGGEIG